MNNDFKEFITVNWRMTIKASIAGSIGTKYNETRVYEIIADVRDDAVQIAIARAHKEGLEHVVVTKMDSWEDRFPHESLPERSAS